MSSRRDRARWGLLVGLVVLVLAAAPAAAETNSTAAGKNPCDKAADAGSIGTAIVQGFSCATGALFGALVAPLLAVGVGVANLVIVPFLGIFEAIFNASGTAGGAAIAGLLGGVADFMGAAWVEAIEGLQGLGLAAPPTGSVIVLVVVAMGWWVVAQAFEEGADLLPEEAEEVLADQDEDDGDA